MKKVLIIDDDEDLVGLIEHTLTWRGFSVQILPDGLNVIDVVRHSNPDLILLDIRLYGESGSDICQELKKRYYMPIILISGDTKKGKAFKDCGADGFLSKPFGISDLLNIINLHLKTAEMA